MTKFTFDQAFALLADGRSIPPDSVLASALVRKVWVARWQMVGCLPDWHSVSLTKRSAIDAALEHASYSDELEGGSGAPRGMRATLARGETFATNAGHAYYIVERVTLSDLI